MATKYAGFIDFLSPNQNLPKMPDFLQSYNRNFNTQLSNLFAPIHPDGWGAYVLGKSTDTAKNFSDVDLGSNASGSSTPSSNGSGTLSGGDPGVLKWSSQISVASKQFGVPQDVIAAIMQNESHGSQYSLSSAGAIGLMQVMPFHFDDGDGDPYDPQTNINKGASILKSNFDMAKSKYGVDDNKAWDIAAAAYLGDWNWKSGTYAGSSDAYGTNGPTYVQKFDDARKQYSVSAPPPTTADIGNTGSVYSIFGGQQEPISQGYGPSDLSGEPADHGYAHFHEGLDIAVPKGTALYAPADATVVIASAPRGVDNGYGNEIYLKTSWGYLLLGHLSSSAVTEGQQIKAGTLLGYSGSTGYSTGPHTHVEVRDQDGNAIDPSTVFSF